MASGTATVKAVISGDTLMLMGSAKNGPPPMLQLTLASVMAPRFARGPKSTDEPYAWEAREALRKALIGQIVSFQVLYKVDSIKRQFGDVTFKGKNVALALAEAGLVKVKQSRDGEKSAVYDELQALGTAAAATKVGVYADDAKDHIRSIKWQVSNAQQLVNKYKGKPQAAVVESLRDGCTFRCMLTNGFQAITFCLAGIISPRMNDPKSAAKPKPVAAAPPAPPAADGEGGGAGAGAGAGVSAAATIAAAAPKGGPAPFAEFAKHFSEVRLLNRDVLLHIRGCDKYQNLYGDIEFPKGNISLMLVKAGLARMVDWSLSYTPNAKLLRAAEAGAKKAKLRMWANYEGPAGAIGGPTDGTVVEIVSGDTLTVLQGGKEVRVSLSSVRAPRMGRRNGDGEEPYAYEAKEYLRKLAIGRKVVVQVDYERAPGPAAAPTGPKRAFATVTLVGRKGIDNIGLLLVSEGYAGVQRHRQDDPRSPVYDDMRAAEDAAKERKLRMHSEKEQPLHRVTDLVGNASKARGYLPFLMRDGEMKAIVDFVHAGGRAKIHIPSQNCLINFALSGMRCPPAAQRNSGKSAGAAAAARPGTAEGNQAYAYFKSTVNQRDVTVTVDGIDNSGCAMGSMYIGTGKSRRSLAVDLLSQGLAKVIPPAAHKLRHGEELFAAEKAARDARRGVWEGYVEEVKVDNNKPEFLDITVAEVVDGGHFYAHLKKNAATLATIESKLAEVRDAEGTEGSPVEVKRGGLVAACFDDGSGPAWFRARVEARPDAAGKIAIKYIDYGNSELVTMSRLRPLDAALSAFPPQALECSLHFVRVPDVSTDAGNNAAVLFHSMVWKNDDLVAKVHSKPAKGVYTVTLFKKSDPTQSVTEALIADGAMRISKTETRYVNDGDKELVQALVNAQRAAVEAHVGIFCYGEVGDSDDEQ